MKRKRTGSTSELLSATVMVAMAAMLATSVYALEVGQNAAEKVIVYVNGDSAFPSELSLAEDLAAKMFADAGVQIDYRIGRPSGPQLDQARVIIILLATHTPEKLRPGALAFAHPFEGIHITVFWDRVQKATGPGLTPKLLAHVLVHEITHIVQGVDRHSDSGVMKARWTDKDYLHMRWKPLPFTPEDVQLMRIGLAKRGPLWPRIGN